MNNSENILPTGLYKHFKGGEYEVLGLAQHSESGESLVVYRCLYGDFDLWVRPKSMFLSSVEVDGVSTPRFSYVGAEVAAGAQIDK